MTSRLQILAKLFIGEALRALSRHTLRSALTSLGITIGTAAVVCVVAIGQAGSEYLEAQLQNLGENLVWIEAGGRNVNGVRSGNHGTTTLTLEDADAVLRGFADQERLAADRWQCSGHLRESQLEYAISRGRAFVPRHQALRERLFGGENPVGAVIRIQAQLQTVVGVLAPKGQSTTGQDQDDVIFIPHTTAQSKFRGKTRVWLDDWCLC